LNASAWIDTKRSAFVARLRVAFFERNEVIAVARQHRAHARRLLDLLLELARDRERDVLFVQAGRSGCTGIVAAVAGIDRDDDVAWLAWRGFGDALHRRRLFRRGIKIEHEPVTELVRGRQQETLRTHALGEVEHDARVVLALLAGADAFEETLRSRRAERVGENARVKVENDAVRLGELEQLVLGRTRHIEHRARVFGTGPDAQILDFSRAHGADGNQRRGTREHSNGPCTSPHGPYSTPKPSKISSFFL